MDLTQTAHRMGVDGRWEPDGSFVLAARRAIATVRSGERAVLLREYVLGEAGDVVATEAAIERDLLTERLTSLFQPAADAGASRRIEPAVDLRGFVATTLAWMEALDPAPAETEEWWALDRSQGLSWDIRLAEVARLLELELPETAADPRHALSRLEEARRERFAALRTRVGAHSRLSMARRGAPRRERHEWYRSVMDLRSLETAAGAIVFAESDSLVRRRFVLGLPDELDVLHVLATVLDTLDAGALARLGAAALRETLTELHRFPRARALALRDELTPYEARPGAARAIELLGRLLDPEG